jgi:hypothetical protein
MAEAARSQVGYVPPQPAVLVVVGREIPVDDFPIARSVEEFRSVEVVAGGPDELVIGPRPRPLLTAILFLVGLAILIVPIVVAELLGNGFGWGLGVILGAIAAFGLIFIRFQLRGLRWVRFDRRSGRVVGERRVGFSPRRVEEWTVPLGSIVAVQLLHNGSHTVSETTEQTMNYRRFYGYELNLILGDPDRRRVPLWSLADWQWVRETGNRIGEFLGVPVIDRLQHGG